MSHFDKFIKNNSGITLLELLIALAISTIILGVAYGVVITGYKTYQKVAIEGAIRDEGDFVISRIMQLFYDTDISDIRNCESTEPLTENTPNFCIEIHNTETSKITSGKNNEKVSITSIDELKVAGSKITQLKINNDNNIIIENYATKKTDDKRIVIDLSKLIDSETINSGQFEFVRTGDLKTSSNIEAECSYSSAIVTDPETPNEKYIKKKCNNGIANITLIIKKRDIDDKNLQFKLNSKFGF